MSAETTANADSEFEQRMKMSGDLGLRLCEHMWDRQGDAIWLGGEQFTVAYNEEIPGYGDDDDFAVLLRRKSDGKLFEAEIDVMVSPVREQAVTP